MSCTLRREENLNDLLDGVLDTAGREETRAHLAACPSCRTTHQELERLALRAGDLPHTMAPPSDLWPDLRRRIEAEKRFAPRPMPRWGLAMAAGLLMGGVIIGAMMGRGLPVGGSPPPALDDQTYRSGIAADAATGEGFPEGFLPTRLEERLLKLADGSRPSSEYVAELASDEFRVRFALRRLGRSGRSGQNGRSPRLEISSRTQDRRFAWRPQKPWVCS